MKNLVFFLFFFSSLVRAETVSFHLDHVPVMELANLIYSDVAKSNFVIDSSVLDLKDSVSVHFSDMDHKQAIGVLEGLLNASGVEVTKLNKVVYLRAVKLSEKADAEEEIFYYRPQFRSVSYITDLCGSLFKNGRFSIQRKVNVSSFESSSVPGARSAVSNVPHQVAQKPVDGGSSAYSQIGKEPDSFFFTGSAAEVEKLKKLLAQVDTAIPQVFVKGMVFEVTTGQKEGSAFGLALNLLKGKLGLSIGSFVSIGDSISFQNASIDAVFSALNSDTRFKSVSNPSLRVQSGASARFSVGSDVPVLGAIQNDRNGNPVQSVEYKPSGVIFDLKPLIRDTGIDLVINQQLSTFIPTTTGVNNSPTLLKREISTSIGAMNNDVIVLGGLDEDRSSSEMSGFPYLPDFMKSKGAQDSKTQILLVLQVQRI